jgi:hypothetical protein
MLFHTIVKLNGYSFMIEGKIKINSSIFQK